MPSSIFNLPNDHLHELAQQHLRVEYELRSDKTSFDSQKEIEDQTTKLDELKDKQRLYIYIYIYILKEENQYWTGFL